MGDVDSLGFLDESGLVCGLGLHATPKPQKFDQNHEPQPMMRPKEISKRSLGMVANCSAFVTGNAKKLEEVKHILTQGNLSVPFKSQALDCTPTPEKLC